MAWTLRRWVVITQTFTILRINRWILFLIPLAFMVVTPWPLSELSLWIGYGQRLWQDWHFLYKDTVSILPTDNNVTSSWLISLVYYGLYQVGGVLLASHFHHLILILILVLIYRRTIFQNPWPWPWQERVAIYAFWLGSGAYFSLRPALIAFLPFIFAFTLIEKKTAQNEEFQKTDWFKLGLLQILWVNLHGSFVLLPLMLGWALLIRKTASLKTWLGFLGVALCTLVNPFGFSIYEYVFKTKEYSQTLGISEWLPATSMLYPLQFVCFWGLVAFVIGFLFKNRAQWGLILASPFIPLVILPMAGLRISTFAFCALPLFLLYRMNLFKRREVQPPKVTILGAAFAMGLILGFMVLGSPYLKEHIQAYLPPHLQSRFDGASVFNISAYIRQAPRACPILNDFNVGGFLMMATPNPLLMDGRVTPFTKEALLTYLDFMSGKGVASVLETTKPCFAVLSLQTHEELVQKLITEFGFENLGGENEYVLLERKVGN